MRWEALSVVGPWGDGFFRRINVARAFLGAAGFTVQAGLTDATEEEAQIKRAMVASSMEVTAIVDHTKWGRAALATFCRTDRLARVVTDAPAPAGMAEAVRAARDRPRRGRSRRRAGRGGRRLRVAGRAVVSERIGFVMRLLPGQEAEYRARHEAVWPELLADLKAAGARNYSIFLRDNDLFAYLEVNDFDAFTGQMAGSEANAAGRPRWPH